MIMFSRTGISLRRLLLINKPRVKIESLWCANFTSVGSNPLNSRYKVLYDGDCSLCQKEIRVLKWMTDRNKNAVDFVDIATPDYDPASHSGVTYEMAMMEMHVIDPQGEVHSKAEAIRQMYEAVGLHWLSRLSRLPGLEPLTDNAYDVFAEYRLQRAFNNCDSGKCSVKVKQLRDKLNSESKGE